LSEALRIVYRAIARLLIHKAVCRQSQAQCGAITLIQRFGSALNLNVHFHMLIPDGVYLSGTDQANFRPVSAPTPAELQALVQRISERLGTGLARKGWLVPTPAHGATIRLSGVEPAEYPPRLAKGPVRARCAGEENDRSAGRAGAQAPSITCLLHRTAPILPAQLSSQTPDTLARTRKSGVVSMSRCNSLQFAEIQEVAYESGTMVDSGIQSAAVAALAGGREL
jgi:Putative transposase